MYEPWMVEEAARLAAMFGVETDIDVAFTGVVKATDEGGAFCGVSEEDATVWYQFKDYDGNVWWIRADDDKWHGLSDEEFTA